VLGSFIGQSQRALPLDDVAAKNEEVRPLAGR